MTLDFLVLLGIWGLTYVVHSTILIAFAWLCCRTNVVQSSLLRERIWKCAACLGFFSAAAATFGDWGNAVQRIPSAVDKAADKNMADVAMISHSYSMSSESFGTQTVPRPVGVSPHSISLPAANPVSNSSLASKSVQDWSRGIDALVTAEELDRFEDFLTFGDAPASHDDKRVVEDEGGVADEGHSAERASGPACQFAPQTHSAFGELKLRRQAAAWVGLVVIIWILCGVVVLLVGHFALQAFLAQCRPLLAGKTLAIWNELAVRPIRRFGIEFRVSHIPALLVTDSLAEPVACGVWSPLVILPATCPDRMAHEELRGLLAHELAHIRRGDIAWLWVGRVLCTCLGFQPLNRCARRAWQAEAEIQCDDWAVDAGVRPIELANGLLQVAEWHLESPSASTQLATSTGGSLSLRIERLVAHDPRDPWRTGIRLRAGYLVAFVAGIVFASWAPRFDRDAWGFGSSLSSSQVEGASDNAETSQSMLQAAWSEVVSELDLARQDLDELEAFAEAEGNDSYSSEIRQFRVRLSNK